MNESAPAEGPREEPAGRPDGPAGSPDGPVAEPPAPRRTRSGAVVVGPTAIARWRPLALVGLPIIALLLCPFAATGIAQWQQGRAAAGLDDLLTRALGHGALQLLAGAIVLWILFALWALVPILATHKVALLDEDARTLALRRGLRTAGTTPLAQVVYAVGEAERGSTGLIGVDRGGEEPERWTLPEVAWDEESFDGLRVLQAAAGLRPAPSRRVLAALARRSRRGAAHRELAARLGMPWRPEYEEDEAAFRAEFDRVRRVLGGKEPPREGDPRP